MVYQATHYQVHIHDVWTVKNYFKIKKSQLYLEMRGDTQLT